MAHGERRVEARRDDLTCACMAGGGNTHSLTTWCRFCLGNDTCGQVVSTSAVGVRWWVRRRDHDDGERRRPVARE